MIRKISTLLLLVSILCGCSTVQTAKQAQGSGESMSYQQPMSVIWPLLPEAINATGGTIRETNEAEKYLLASYGMSAWSWGEEVALFCRGNEGGTTVEVVSKAKLKTNITAVKRAPEIFKFLDESLRQ